MGQSIPQLEDALGLFDKRDSDSVPEKDWIRKDKASYQPQIEKILDTVIRVLEISGAGECRKQIKTLQQAITESQQRIAKCHEQLLSALPEASLAVWEKPWKRSRESLEESTAAEERNITDIGRQIGELKERFRNQLQQIGLEVFDGDVVRRLASASRTIGSLAAFRLALPVISPFADIKATSCGLTTASP